MFDDYQIVHFICLLKENSKAYLIQLTLDTAVWIPKSQIVELDVVFGKATLYNTFTVGGKEQEFIVWLNKEV